MIPDFSGDFLTIKSTQDGDICEIMDEGQEQFSQALGKKLFNIKVKKNDKVFTWTPNNEAGRSLQTAWGKDSKNWIGKKFQIFHISNSMKIKPI